MPHERFQFTGVGGHQLAAALDTPDGPIKAYALFAHCFTCGKDVLAAKRIATALAATTGVDRTPAARRTAPENREETVDRRGEVRGGEKGAQHRPWCCYVQ